LPPQNEHLTNFISFPSFQQFPFQFLSTLVYLPFLWDQKHF